jgi:RsiW-degrading membrane proteinase PrsW (M82 family)
MTLWLFALGFAPGIFWLLYFYSRDKLEPEPRGLVVRTFLLGMVAAIPAALLEGLFLWVGAFLLIVAIGPAIEEYAKYFVVTRSIYRSKEFSEPMDGIVYAVAAALGFASLENVGYLLAASSLGAGDLAKTFWARALLSVPAHALFSSMWGYALGFGMLIRDPMMRRAFINRGLWLAIGLHGLFNFLALASGTGGLLGAALLLLLVLFAWRAVHRRIASALEHSPYRPDSPDISAEPEGRGDGPHSPGAV